MAKYFPVFLNIQRRPCLIVGAGAIATAKAKQMLEYDATLTVVSPKASETIKNWAADGTVAYFPRHFHPDDLEGQLLVIASTNDEAVNRQVFEEASRRGIMSNIVDVPELCSFIYGAIVQRGDLQIAISTSGISPAFASHLRKQLEQQFGEEYATYLEMLGEVRKIARERLADLETQKRAYNAILEMDLLSMIAMGDAAEAREIAIRQIARFA